jgi:hypothetical protein
MRNTIIHATILCASSFAVGCVDLDEAEPVDEDTTELADTSDDTALDEAVLDDQPEVASGEEPTLPPGCEVYAWTPTYEGWGSDQPIASGASWYGCPAGSRVVAELRQHRSWWPDRLLDQRIGTGSSGTLLLSEPCRRGGPSYVFTEVKFGYGDPWRRKSVKVQVPCHF